jgi:hypothetical protein
MSPPNYRLPPNADFFAMNIAYLLLLFCRLSLSFGSHGHYDTKIHFGINDKLKMIHDILQQRNHFNNNRCGKWKDNYLQQYKHLLANPENDRQYLVAVPNLSGMCHHGSLNFLLFSFSFVRHG